MSKLYKSLGFKPKEALAIVCVFSLLHQFSGAFAKLQKATISFVMSVHPSVLMEHLGSHWMDFHEI
jgi:hypothetical protein